MYHTSNSTTAQKPLLPRLTIASLQIYQLPDWRLVFLVKNFPVGQRVLVDSSFGQPTTQGEVRKEEATRQGELPLVKEVLLVALGSRQSRPYLLVSVFLPPGPCLPLPPTYIHLTIPAWIPRYMWTRSCLSTKPFPTTLSLAREILKSVLRRCQWLDPTQAWGRRLGQQHMENLELTVTSNRSPTTSTSAKRSQNHPRRRLKVAALRRDLESGAAWHVSATLRIFMAIQGYAGGLVRTWI